MANIIVLGTGRVGKAIAIDLSSEHNVTTVDIDTQALDDISADQPQIKTIQADLRDHTLLANSIKPADLVINAVPGYMGYQTLKGIISNRCNVVDIAFFPENALELDGLARKNNITAVVDMGIAPGMSNLILGHHNEEMDVQYFHCMVGGLPLNPQPPFNYKAPFSPVDVIEEYTRPARIVVNGKQVTLPALSDIELVDFSNIGTLEAFNTDGLRTLLNSFPNIPYMVEKTLRYPGHAALIATLQEIGFFSEQLLELNEHRLRPLDLTVALLKKQWQLEKTEKEFTVMRIVIEGLKQGQTMRYQYDLYDEYDDTTKTISMARTTGYSCTAVANLLLEGRFRQTGIIPPEYLGKDANCFNYIMDYLARRRVTFSVQSY